MPSLASGCLDAVARATCRGWREKCASGGMEETYQVGGAAAQASCTHPEETGAVPAVACYRAAPYDSAARPRSGRQPPGPSEARVAYTPWRRGEGAGWRSRNPQLPSWMVRQTTNGFANLTGEKKNIRGAVTAYSLSEQPVRG